MLPDRENSHRLQQATTWHQEGHRTLCPNPFHGHATLPGEVTETSRTIQQINHTGTLHTTGNCIWSHGRPQWPSAYPCNFNRRTSGPSRKTFSKQRQIFGQYFGDILRERQRLLHGMVTLLLNFYWTYFEFICMNFNELFMNFLKCIVLILCLDYYYVLYWFLLWILIDLMIWKIWLILLTCIAL